MNNFTKKSLHLVKEVAPKPVVRAPYVLGVHTPFNAKRQFHTLHEKSEFFDLFLPEGCKYVEMTVLGGDEDELEANTAWFDSIIGRGMPILGVVHHVLYADWDDRGTAIMVPVDMVKDLTSLGLRLKINSDSDKLKVRKYFRRVRAHHEWAIKGSLVDVKQHSNGVAHTVRVDGYDDNYAQFSVLHVDLDTLATKYDVALADGIHLIDVELCKTLGLMFGISKLIMAKVGDAFKGTELDGYGLAKGFFHVVAGLHHGIIGYGVKKQVTFDHFFLGSLGDVKGGDAYTDLQAMINFGMYDGGLAYQQAVLFIDQVAKAIHNEKQLRHLFLTHLAPVAELLNKEEEGGRETWVLLEALRKGVSLRKNPGLFRRVIRHLFTHVLDVTKGRIPFLGIGARFNLMPDLNCFDADGGVDYTKSSIPENCVVCMDLPAGPLGMYRQPSGNPEEQVLTTNVHDRRFKRFRGRNRIIMGSMAWYYLSLMGGGDMDDAVNAVVDGIWLEFMDKARNYPITPLPEAQKTVSLDDNNKYRRTPRYPRFWSKVDAFEATAAAKERKLSIGPVVNAVMLDILLSGEHKENMLTTLADQIAEKGADAYAFTKSIGIGENATYQTYTLGMVYDWLRNRPDHILRVVGSNLEAFIDYVKMGKGDPTVLEPLVKLITEVRDSSLVIPQSFLIERKLKGQTRVRVTERRLLARDFWVLPSLVCDALNQIKFEVDQLQEALVEEQWLNVDSLPESLSLAFPKDQASRDEAIDLRMKWGAAFSNRSGSDLESIYKSVVEEVVDPAFNRPDFNADIKMALAVEHARFTYKGRKTEARRNEDGSRRNYPDGLLWTNTVGTWYIKALEAAGLTGLYAPVEFDRWSRNYSRGEYQVNVIGNEVFNAIDGTYFGEVSDPEVTNGNYIMSDGMLTVIEPSTELYEDRNIVDETYSNPVDLGIDSELEALLASL